ncbi:hypothetical protein BJX64DRAFT_271461 [Aspergillus heterothallicus]
MWRGNSCRMCGWELPAPALPLQPRATTGPSNPLHTFLRLFQKEPRSDTQLAPVPVILPQSCHLNQPSLLSTQKAALYTTSTKHNNSSLLSFIPGGAGIGRQFNPLFEHLDTFLIVCTYDRRQTNAKRRWTRSGLRCGSLKGVHRLRLEHGVDVVFVGIGVKQPSARAAIFAATAESPLFFFQIELGYFAGKYETYTEAAVA